MTRIVLLRRLCGLVLLLGLLAGGGPTAAQVLAAAGTPAGEIILAANPDLRERFAARELQYWIAQITGAKLPLLALPSAQANTKLFVGSAWAAAYGADVEFLKGSDGFAVRRKGNNVYIFGAQPAGTLYGVWRLLEENTDIIWARPNPEIGTVYGKTPNLTLTRTELRDRPVFSFRSWSMPGGVPNETTHLWQNRNGCNGQYPKGMSAGNYLDKEMGRYLNIGGGFMYGFLGKYKETNPEFFPYVDGRRVLSNHAQPCFTNPEAVKTLIKEAREQLKNAPDETIILDCGNEDTWRCCECESCLKPLTLPDGTTLAPKSPSSEKDPLFRSTQMFMFLNKVAEDLVKDYPHLKIMTLAYIFAAEPPAVTVHPSIMVLFAPYPTVNMRFPLLQHGPGVPGSWATRFQEWGNRKTTLAFYEYWGVGYFNAMGETAAINLQDLQKFGGLGVNSEALQDIDTSMEGIGSFAQAWDANAIEMWVISRLMWNPNQEVKALRRQYITRTYREAAPQMTRFYGLIEQAWNDPKNRQFENCHSGRGGVFKRYLVDTGKEKEARALLVEAEQAAQHPTAKILVGRVLQQFDAWAKELGRLTVPLIPEAAVAGEEFTSPHWEKTVPITDFKLPRSWAKPTNATCATEVRFLRDQANLYVRVVANDPEVAKAWANPRAAQETFPLGDHAEIYLRSKSGTFLFAMDCQGNHYDARNWDRRWNSTWRVKTRKTDKSWEALAVIPLAEIGIDVVTPATKLEGIFARIYHHGQEKPEESTYKGMVVHGEHVWSPLVFE